MKSITIHKIDDDLVRGITDRARRHGLSLNKTIKNLLKEALGLTNDGEKNHRKDFQSLLGSWTDEDIKEFEAAIADLNRTSRKD